jgi:uncharacterized protein (DUF1330 family)
VHRMLTVITKHPHVPTAEFRAFMRDEYGPVYQAMPQVRAYTQHFLSAPGAETGTGPDAVVVIAFDSPDSMRLALDTDAYRAAAARRNTYMATIQARVLDATVTLA